MNGILTACYFLIALNFKVESKVDKKVKFLKRKTHTGDQLSKPIWKVTHFPECAKRKTPLGPIFNCFLTCNVVTNFIVERSNEM